MWNSRAIIFDLDDTLLSESYYFEAVFFEFCLIHKWPKESYLPIIYNFNYIRTHEKDIFSYFLNCNRQYWSSNGELFDSLRDGLFSLYINIDAKLRPTKGALEWIDYARQNSLIIGVLTNGVVKAQYNKWKNLDLPNKEDIVFVAARECVREKPFSDPFIHISKSIGIDMGQITFVGDRYENDLAYPLSVGATGIVVSEDKIAINHDNCYCSRDLSKAFLLFKKTNKT